MTHTKQMYVVVNSNGIPQMATLAYTQFASAGLFCNETMWGHYQNIGYTVQPVIVTIELP